MHINFVLSHCHLNKEVHRVSGTRLYNLYLEKLDLRYLAQPSLSYLYTSWGKKLTCPMQDVQDCLTALDHVIKEELIDASRVAVVGISHGGFLTTHLIGQVKALTDFRTK